MTVALVTGGYGFVGSHLRPLLQGRGWDIVALGRVQREPAAGDRYLQADLTRPHEVAAVLDTVRPDVVFHLAASSEQNAASLSALVADAVTGTQSLCAGLRRVGLRPRVVLVGSSAQYGAVPRAENPISEDTLCRPVSAYGFAKMAAEATAYALAIDGAFELVPARAFNHAGPGEPPTTVAGAFAARVAAVLDGRADRVAVADLEAVRDFTDVRDIARGYLALAERGAAGRIYNLCSGRGATIGDVLDGLLAAAGLDRSIVDVASGGKSGIPYQVGSPARIHAETGWAADIPLDASLAELLAWVRGTQLTVAGQKKA